MKIIIVLLLVAQCLMAENKFSLLNGGKNIVTLRLSNTNPIAGMQFSINARGIALKAFEGTDRTTSSALSVYQYIKDANTLNVVILAPVRSTLPVGDGLIGRITFETDPLVAADSCEVFLTRVEICGQNAVGLDYSTERLAWQLQTGSGELQSAFSLQQNYPNPFNPSTTIAYRIENASHVILSVYDITGRQVETLVDQYQAVGTYQVRWNAEGAIGHRLASGVYIAKLQVGGRVSARTMNYTK